MCKRVKFNVIEKTKNKNDKDISTCINIIVNTLIVKEIEKNLE